MEEQTVPRTERAKAAVARARKIRNSNNEMAMELRKGVSQYQDSQEVYSVPLEDYEFNIEGVDQIVHQKIRTTNKFVTFFRDMLSQ